MSPAPEMKRLLRPALWPNLLTGARIVLAPWLLVLSPGGGPFTVLYLSIGLTDLLDGPLARRLGTASRFGARLDSVADLVFLGGAAGAILPVLSLPWPLYAAAIALLLCRGVTQAVLFCRLGRLDPPHLTADRAAGLALFLWPLTFSLVPAGISAIIPLLFALAAAAAELRWALPIIRKETCRVSPH